MARSATNQAKDTFNQSKGVATQAGQNAQGIFGELLPQYEQEATNPQGYSPDDLNAMNTSAQESAGGATAAAVGQNNLMAARTRNRGGYQIANDEAMREGGRRIGDAALRIKSANADLKQRQRSEGLAGMSGLYGENSRDQLGALGLENESTNALTNAGKSGWLQNTLAIINALNPNYSKGSGFGVG